MDYVNCLETKSLLLAKAKQEDLISIFNNYWSSVKTAKFMLWEARKSLEEAQELLNKTIEFQNEHLAFFVYEKSTGEVIGSAGMIEIEKDVYEDCGIGIGENFVGKGYGKQILRCLIDYLFDKLNAKKIICSCHNENIASAKLQQSCGLKYDHSEMYTRKKDGLTYKADYYVITKEQWLNDKNILT